MYPALAWRLMAVALNRAWPVTPSGLEPLRMPNKIGTNLAAAEPYLMDRQQAPWPRCPRIVGAKLWSFQAAVLHPCQQGLTGFHSRLLPPPLVCTSF